MSFAILNITDCHFLTDNTDTNADARQ